MDIIKSIRTWKPLKKSKSAQSNKTTASNNSDSSDNYCYSEPVLSPVEKDHKSSGSLDQENNGFYSPSRPQFQQRPPLSQPPPQFLQPKKQPLLYQEPQSLIRAASADGHKHLQQQQQQQQENVVTSSGGFKKADFCPSCQEPFDCGKKRRLIDSCGHERCYTCMFSKELCSLCSVEDSKYQQPPRSIDFSPFRRAYRGPGGPHGSPATRSVQSEVSPLRSFRNGLQNTAAAASTTRVFATPPAPRRRYLPSPKSNRPSWMQRHLRRPQTVNVDDSTLSDDASSTSGAPILRNSASRGSFNHPSNNANGGGHLTPSHFARSSSLGGHTKVANPSPLSSLGHESGFQSCTSLVSLSQQKHSLFRGSSPISARLRPPPASESSLSGSMASLASGVIVPMMRHSLNNQPRPESRISAISNSRRSARQLTVQEREPLIDPRESFSCVEQPHWVLKPLFFEVPQRDPNPLFVGRHWLFGEVAEHLASNLPTNKGVVIVGGPGTGKTSLLLKLVEMSCFGRGEPIYQETSPQNSPTRNWRLNPQLLSLSNQVVSYHFCQVENAPTCSVPEFVHSMASQLSQSPILKPYYQLLVSNHKIRSRLTMEECLANPDDSFIMGIVEPLRSLHGQENIGSVQCVILIDGLCDSEIHRPDQGDTIGTFIAKHLETFPHWLKVVCTVRSSMPQVTRCLPFHQVNLDKISLDERLKKDMVDYIQYRVEASQNIQINITPLHLVNTGKFLQLQHHQEPQSPADRFIQYLTEASGGSFLFSKLVLDLVERGHLVIKSSSFKVLPVSLSQVFQLECNLKFSSVQSFSKVTDILSVCLASLVPLTVPEIYNGVRALQKEPDCSWQEFVARFNLLSGFLVRRGDDTVMFYHPLFRDWLIRRKDNESTKFMVDPRNGHLALALTYSRQNPSCSSSELNAEKILDLCHHMLKAHVYRNNMHANSSKDLQSVWLCQVAAQDQLLSQALGSTRNIYSPNVNVSRLLLLAGASPHYVGGLMQNAPLLALFALEGYEEMVNLLIEFGADVNCRNADGITPLMFACQKGRSEVARSLVQHGAVVNAVDNGDKSALVYAAEHGHLDILELLVACDWDTCTLLGSGLENTLGLVEAAQQATVMAASKGNIKVLEYLLDMHEVLIDQNDSLSGETPLCAASASGQHGSCLVLIRRGASLSATNLKESPPLHMATRQGHWGVADTLLKEGADPNQLDGGHRSPLMIAALEGHLGLCELLLSRAADLETADREGLTSLSWACLKGQVQTAALLIKQGCDIEHADKSGRTCLDLAAYKGNPEVVSLLLENGANMEHMDLNGMRPLDRAISCRNPGAVQCFLRRGAKLGPATWAMAKGKPDIMLLLLNKLLDDGNTLFKKEQISEAAHRYQYALRKLPSVMTNTLKQGATKSTFEQLNIHLLLNLSRCKRKSGQLEEAVDLAAKVLHLQPNNFEAYYAKAKAHKAAGRLHAALQDLTEALRIAPQHREVHKVILKIKDEISSSQSATSTSSTSSESRNLNKLKTALNSTENDSTSGVDSTGSSSCSTKDFENDNCILSNTHVI